MSNKPKMYRCEGGKTFNNNRNVFRKRRRQHHHLQLNLILNRRYHHHRYQIYLKVLHQTLSHRLRHRHHQILQLV